VRNFAAIILMAGTNVVLGQDAVPVIVQPLDEILVEREIRAPATVLPRNEAVVTSQLTALIDDVAADVAENVARGALLVRLDDADARLALAQAEADLAALEAQIAEAGQRLTRAEELLEKNFISDDELDNRRTAVTVLEANRQRQQVAIDRAMLDVARTEIRAPYDAVVVARQGQVGSLATPGSPLLTIVQLTDREVDAEVDPGDAASLRAADELRFESQGQSWAVVLARLSGVIETNTRKLRGRFRFADEVAPVGRTGHVAWVAALAQVPVNLIVQRGDALGVFTVQDGRARFVPLPDAQEGRPATADLPEGTAIVTRGQVRLQDGDPLLITRE
jgi:RND family efflux transporter MFP subunit